MPQADVAKEADVLFLMLGYPHDVERVVLDKEVGILQHMKKQDLAINEAVFHSLLAAHCLNFDPDSVSSTLEVMTNSGLNIGADGKFEPCHLLNY